MPPLAAERQGRRPNIIFILADDLGYGHLGCYGQKQIQTPRLDAMAAQGIRFTDAYAGCTVCAPSRCSLMTGMHQGHAWIRGNTSKRTGERVPLRPEDTTVAQLLKQAGYATGVFGKWGLGEPDTTGIPNRKGFDEWFGYLNQAHAHSYYPDYLWDNERRVDIPKGAYSHDLFTGRGLDFVRRHRDGPFFLYMACTVPHAQLEPPDDAPYSGREWPQKEKNLAAMITSLDRDVGRVLDLLKELGIDQDTIVFFTSDNGPHSEGGADAAFFQGSGPLRGIKRDLYEGGIRVPMIARWPGRIGAGHVSQVPWAFWDFLPTCAELAGVRTPDGLDGVSVVPALLAGTNPVHSHLYWEFHEGQFNQAVRLRDWKGIRRAKDGPIELYNLKDDIAETHDVSARNPLVVGKIAAIMREEHAESPEWPVQ